MARRYLLIEWDEAKGRRSFSTPRGAETLADGDDLIELLHKTAAMCGAEGDRLVADGDGGDDG